MQEEKQGIVSRIGDFFWSALFVVGGVVFALFITYIGIKEFNQYQHWDEYQQLQGEVSELYVYSKNHNSVAYGVAKTSTSWHLGGKYHYLFESKEYEKQDSFESFSTESEAKEALKDHHVGEAIRVWFHPDRPDEAILDYQKPTIGNSLWFIGFGAAALLLFMGLLVGWIKDMFMKEERE